MLRPPVDYTILRLLLYAEPHPLVIAMVCCWVTVVAGGMYPGENWGKLAVDVARWQWGGGGGGGWSYADTEKETDTAIDIKVKTTFLQHGTHFALKVVFPCLMLCPLLGASSFVLRPSSLVFRLFVCFFFIFCPSVGFDCVSVPFYVGWLDNWNGFTSIESSKSVEFTYFECRVHRYLPISHTKAL